MSDVEQMTALMCPDYTESNPYQSELIAALEGRGVDVTAADADGAAPLLSAVRANGVPDVVHVHWLHRFVITERRFPAPLALLLGLRLCLELVVLRALGARLVWTVHNLLDHERVAPRSELLVRAVVARLVDGIVVHCEAAARSVADTYRLSDRAAARIRVVDHGHFADVYADEVSASAARERLGLAPDVPVVCFFGLIRPYKDVPRLAETFESISGDARLLIVGNPWNEAVERRVRAASAGDDRIRTVLEYVPDDEVQVYLRAADAVALPFDSVLTSGSAILAMTFGRAVVAPSIGCLPGLLTADGGVLYDPSDSDGLRNALERALEDRDRLIEMGRRNEAAARRLDWDRIAERTRAVYAGEAARERGAE